MSCGESFVRIAAAHATRSFLWQGMSPPKGDEDASRLPHVEGATAAITPPL